MEAKPYWVKLMMAAGCLVLGAAAPSRAIDTDGDGVDDVLDDCCDTPTGVAVDARGRPLGDIDLDCDTDLDDFESFQLGFTGVLGSSEDRLCHPVAQVGCEPCEKCTFVRDAANPGDWRTYCRPEGAVQANGACTTDGATGLENCAAGLVCERGVCAEICSTAPDSCPSGQECTALPNLVDSPSVGFCLTPCDPLSSSPNCLEGEACFLDLARQTSVCVAASGTATQGVACQFLNGCATGYSCALTNSPVAPTGLVCAFICDASQGGGPTCAQGPGVSFACVPLNRFYANTQSLPDAYGMCVTPAEWDEDGDSVLDYEDQCPGTPSGTSVDEFGCP